MSTLLDGLQVQSQLLVDDQKLLQSSQFDLLMRPDAITALLHEYGARLLQELHERQGGGFSSVDAMQTLNKLFFHDWGFVAKDESTELSYESIYFILTTPTGRPCCICVLSNLILHQIGVPAYVHPYTASYCYIIVELETDDVHWFEVRHGQPFPRRLTF
jgi:regulator of sirC expression with transglutaminase-like and TPR domain